ncbi:hypothetical protein LTR84_005106 [Exophiala bonariae]|uniref:Transcription factor domain-containing protein n=1 Tax=Exophiala bonariae TaxID=1690606 RepID=A0AAV9NSU6_9EURO|nr:hypothetical protein LTR84_005106 [Exophiala bonariae]
MLFVERSFLATKPWIDFTQEMWLGEHAGEWSPMERLLDIMTLASDLCVRVMEYTHSNGKSSSEDEILRTLATFAEEGHRLRSDLYSWEEMAQIWPSSTKYNHQMMIAWVFYPAISIYLSGIYDYDRIWEASGITTPGLPRTEVQQNVGKILDRTALALKGTNVTALVFLFPLRIAGARVTTVEEQENIRTLLAQISCSFSVANAISSDLGEVWADPVPRLVTTA